MVRPSYVRALVASYAVLAATLTGLVGLSATTTPAQAATAAAPVPAPAEEDTAPLGVTISSMTPASLPASGTIAVTGTVTNRTDETWSNISLLAFVGDGELGALDEPFRNQGELEASMATPYDAVVGQRLTVGGRPGEVEELAPGATSIYRVTVPVDAIEPNGAGVYWFGVHALGSSPSRPYDGTAVGRARTYLPVVPRRFHDRPLDVALVLPLTAPVRWSGDGRVADPESWASALGPEGRLTRLLDFADQAPVITWLVDPALVDAVAHLAAGNPPRTLGPGTDETTSADPSTAPAEDDDVPPTPEAQQAATWLDDLGRTLRGDEVYTLPYGNPDLPSTLEHAPRLLDVARAQRSEALTELGVEPRPVITSPTGYLDADSIAAAGDDARVLVTDRMFADLDGREPPPAVADVDGRRVLVTSHGAVQGSPGPGPSLTPTGLRQRVLAEAAVREIKGDRRPMVVVLPSSTALDDPAAFFAGLSVPWLDLGTLDDVDRAATATPVDAADLGYPALQGNRELDGANVAAVEELVAGGDALQNVLVDDTGIGGTITEEALTGLSYFARYDEAAALAATDGARAWVDERLDGIQISDSPGITLASSSGTFAVTLTNNLDHRVAVSVRAESDRGIEVTAPERIVLEADGRATAQLRATTTTNAVHNVRLQVTDPAGTPLGASAQVPIRPTQVSDVIWLIIGTGAGLLFLAIAVRLVRRVRAARRGEPGAGRRGSSAAPPPVEVG
ncbi:DUF6049 family protein [Nocardioides sp. C4-1]|uniref:DUF6049 family protein n=1 Tax=Nocardioides sp. C4-1 TaxID=3151851 RepID=UPI003267C340